MSSKNLLQEFPPVTTQTWEDAIRKDLKGADYNKKLLWKAEDGVTVKPYYRSEDVAGLATLNSTRGAFRSARGEAEWCEWRIREEITAPSAGQANKVAQTAILAGAEEIAFRGVPLNSAEEFHELVANLEGIPVHFADAPLSVVQLVADSGKLLQASSDWNPFADLAAAAKLAGSVGPGFRPFAIRADRFEQSGATTVQEVGFAIAAGIDYLAEMEKRNVDAARAASSIAFSMTIGSNYFFNIAKLRALRMLWARAVDSFDGAKCTKATIYARTSEWNKTIYDPHVNVLRATMEAMSAALGGADSIAVASFEQPYKHPDEASRRLARNTQVILKKEAYLGRVSDPGGGSYYLEVLTDTLARQSWETMQSIEAAGGYSHQEAAGIIQTELKKSLTAAVSAIAARKRLFLGTNYYPNPGERALDRIEPGLPHEVRRGPEVYEGVRLRTERHCAAGGKCPKFLLAAIGDAKMRSARSSFAANFFLCGGFEIVAENFENVEGIARTDSDVIVLCSSDPEYPELAGALLEKLNGAGRQTPVVVAGYPELVEQLRQLGVSDFVHVRSHHIELLKQWQSRLGVKD